MKDTVITEDSQDILNKWILPEFEVIGVCSCGMKKSIIFTEIIW